MTNLKLIIHSLIPLLLGLTIGCAASRPVMPIMDLPPEPQKPAIKTVIVPKAEQIIVGYSIQDSLKLFEYLLRKDAYEEKLRYRINSMNELLRGKN